MTHLFLWLLIAATLIYAIALTFPMTTLEVGRQIMRWIRSYYAKRHGLAEAEKAIPIEPWEARPWERHWQPNRPVHSPSKPPQLWDLIRLQGLTPKYLFLVALIILRQVGILEIKVKAVRKIT